MQLIEDDPFYLPPAEEQIALLNNEISDRDEYIGLLETALNDIFEMFDGQQDADQPSGEAPIPNQAMKICTLIEEALAKGKLKL
jgi:hypothetical protein